MLVLLFELDNFLDVVYGFRRLVIGSYGYVINF